MGCCSNLISNKENIVCKSIRVHKDYTNNIIFDSKLKLIYQKLDNLEQIRKEISKKYENLLITTGSIVIKSPSFIASIECFFLYILYLLNSNKSILPDLFKKQYITIIKEAPFLIISEKLEAFYNSEDPLYFNSKTAIISFLTILDQQLEKFNYIYNEYVTQKDDIQYFVNEFKIKHHKVYQENSIHTLMNFTEKGSQDSFTIFLKKTKSSLNKADEIVFALSIYHENLQDLKNRLNNYLIDLNIFQENYNNFTNKYSSTVDSVDSNLISSDTKNFVWHYYKEKKIDKLDKWDHNLLYQEEFI